MKQLYIGIHISAEPARLRATLGSLRAYTPQPFGICLLEDGVEREVQAFLQTLPDLAHSATSEPRGAAACFNRLIQKHKADVYVFLESGVLVGPGWLEFMLTALAADPRNGLAGPSTNRAWNEQCVFPQAEDSPAAIAETARQAALRFGKETRTLEPLYSLGDFCFVVRREVIEAIGGADESYGLGPCWEMDYNLRAARAGWHGVWACSAYVHRAPCTSRRRRDEARYFERNKQRYQDKFCGARLRKEKDSYRQHCNGDACPNFAPPALIRICEPLKADLTQPVPASNEKSPAVSSEINGNPHKTVEAKHRIELPPPRDWPLVSCIMPTANRRGFIPQSLRCFLRQDYPALELIVVDDGADSVADCMPDDPRVRYFRLEAGRPLGAKRNFACEQARGEFIVHWDDDDWYPAWRVRTQVQALRASNAEICGTSHLWFFNPATSEAWNYRYSGKAAWVAGSALSFRRSFWQQQPFPSIRIGEDSRFVFRCVRERLVDLKTPALLVATVHDGNTSRKQFNGAYWQARPFAEIVRMLGDDRFFYRLAVDLPSQSLPLVSCIMPTYNRARFIPLTLERFRRQDYPRRELIVVDDGEVPIESLVADLPNVRYIRLSSKSSIGAKRNLACQEAQGEIIAHWDDDDWYSDDRLRYEVMPILTGEAELTGLDNAFVVELPEGQFWTTAPELHQRMFVGNVHGGTLVYQKNLLSQGIRYPEINLAEDAALLRQAMKQGNRLLRLSNPGVFVYARHGHNAWGRWRPGSFLDPTGWKQTLRPVGFSLETLARYQKAAVTIAA